MLRAKTKDFTTGGILKPLLYFAIPLALANLIQQLFSAVDVIVIGRFGDTNAQASVGSSGEIVKLLINFFTGFGTGAGILVAKAHGAKDDERKSRVLHSGIAVSAVAGLIVVTLGMLFTRPLLKALNTPSEILDMSTLYLMVVFIGKPATLIYSFGAGALRSVGKSKKPLFYLTVSGVVKCLLTLLTVGVFKWHVFGAALSSVISIWSSAILVVIDLKRGETGVPFYFKKIRFHKQEVKDIFRLGVPLGLSSSAISISSSLVQSRINAFGTAVIAGNSAAGSVHILVEQFPNAIASGVVAFVGQNVGAKKDERVPKILGSAGLILGVYYALITIMHLTCGRFLCGLYNSDPLVIDYGMERIYWCDLWVFAGIGSKIFGSAFKGMGKPIFPTTINLVSTCGLRFIFVVVIYPFLPVQSYGVVLLSLVVAWLLSSVVEATAYFIVSTRMKKNKLRALALENVEAENC